MGGDRMKKILQISILALLAITYLMIGLSYSAPTCTLLGEACTPASYNCDTCTAESTSVTHVQAAANATARNGIVNVPAGDSNWGTALTLTRAIKLRGAGTSSTYIRQGQMGSNFLIDFVTASATDDSPYILEVSGFTFDMNYQAFGLRFRNRSSATPVNINIGNNVFTECWDGDVVSGDPMSWTIHLYGRFVGVIHSNSFSGFAYVEVDGDGVTNFNSSTYNVTYGSANYVYIEDNYFYRPIVGDYTGAEPFILPNSNGARIVQRYNDFVSALTIWTYSKPWSPHHPTGGINVGGKGGEFYGNYLKKNVGYGSWLWGTPRAGKNLMFYNRLYVDDASLQWTMYNPSSYPPAITTSACGSGVYTPWIGAYYCDPAGQPQHIWQSYQWVNKYGNTGSGSYTSTTVSDGGRLTENSHYYNYKTSFDGTVGVGCGTAATMNAIETCTDGVGFWVPNATLDPTAASCSDITNWVGRNNALALSANGNIGTLYKCASNSWVSYYTPYTYPHPWRQGLDTESGQLSTPTACSGEDCTTPLGCTGDDESIAIGVTATDNIGITGVKCCLENGSTCIPTTTYANMDITLTNSSGNLWGTTVTSACDDSIAYNCKGTDLAGNITSNIVISYDTEANEDTTDPTLSTQVLGVAGRTLTLTFSEPVKKGAEYLDTDWVFEADASRVQIECPSNAGWDTDTLVCQASECVADDAVLTLDYNQPGVGLGITDQADNTFIIGDAVSVTNNSEQTCDIATSLFTHGESAPSGSTTNNDTKAVNLGVKFQSSVAGTITHLWFYKVATNTGTHVGSVWCASASCGGAGTLLGQVTFADETASGWQSMELGTPVGILADVDYIVSYHNPAGIWTQNANYFASTYTNGNLTATTSGIDYAGRYTYSASSAYPSGTYKSNYWVDFTMSYAGAGGPWDVTVSKTGEGCSIASQPTEPVVDEATSEVVVTVKNGWAVGISGDCPAGSGILSGNTYTYTTGQITDDCEVAVTCSEINLVPWVTP
jgi:hypothetical protein